MQHARENDQYVVVGLRDEKVVVLRRAWPHAFATARRLRALGWRVVVQVAP
jgi:hypothetical protein